MSKSRLMRFATLAAILALVAASCSSGKTNTPATPKKGGSIVVAAEQWLTCMNPLTSCNGALWQNILNWQVMPRLSQWDEHTNLVHSDLTTEVPSLTNGGITKSPFTVTYHLNPKAVWADGTPITSKDVRFTWLAKKNTKGVYATAGYDLITDVDASVPQTVVIKFKSIYTDWPDLFGGNDAGILEAAAFPNNKNADLTKVLQTGPLPFSGGPWIQQTFTTTESVFVRNTKFWGTQTLLDKMTLVPRTDQNTEIQALLSGEVQVVGHPQPTNVSLLRQLAPNPNAKAITTTGNFYEALFLNNEDPVLKDNKVREALFYAVDRQQVIDGLIKLNKPDAQILNCAYISLPGSGPWCGKSYFDQFSYQPSKALSILKDDGWNCDKVPASPCTKASQSLNMTYRFCNGNARRQTTYELLKEKAPAAGFKFTQVAKGSDCSSPLFDQTLPKGLFQIGDYGQGPVTDPTPTGNAACEQVPTKANSYAGGNYERWCNRKATDLMHQSDAELDNTKRLALLQQVYELEVADHVLLPLYVLPSVIMYRADKIGGPIGTWNDSPYTGMFNSNEWYLK